MSRIAATTEGYGIIVIVDYAASTSNLNYVDRKRIAATGHSAGGNAAVRGANFFCREAQRTGKPGKYYGELKDRTLRVIHNERIIHPFQPYMMEATANQIEYFEKVFNIESNLSSHDQVWYWQELPGAVSMVTALVALIPLSRDRKNLPGPDGDLPDFHHRADFQHGFLPATVTRPE